MKRPTALQERVKWAFVGALLMMAWLTVLRWMFA